MDDETIDKTSADDADEQMPEATHEEVHESKLHHFIHEITEDVKGLFDLDVFLHSDGNIGGITGVTEDERTDNNAEDDIDE